MWNTGIFRRFAGITARPVLVSPRDEDGVRPLSRARMSIGLIDHCPMVSAAYRAGGIEEVIGLRGSKLLKENLVELVVVVLAWYAPAHGSSVPVQLGDDAATS